MQKTVMVIGSAPGAQLLPSDHIFFANFSAIAFAADVIRNTGARTTTVCAASAYFFRAFPDLYIEAFDPNKPRSNTFESMEDRLTKLKAAPIDQTLVYGHKTRYVAPAFEAPEKVEVLGPEHVFESFRILGLERDLRWPLSVLREGVLGTPRIPRKDLKRFMKELLWKRPDYFFSSGYFRPSSGLTAIAEAMRVYGQDARYLISGITFENRDSYGANLAIDKNVRISSKHTAIDRILMDKIKERYQVEFI